MSVSLRKQLVKSYLALQLRTSTVIRLAFDISFTNCYYFPGQHLFSTRELNALQKQPREQLLQLSVSGLISLSKISLYLSLSRARTRVLKAFALCSQHGPFRLFSDLTIAMCMLACRNKRPEDVAAASAAVRGARAECTS